MPIEDLGAQDAAPSGAASPGAPLAQPEVAEPKSIRDLLIILREPESHVAESIRSVRTSLQRHLASGLRGLLVLSPWGGDGKSTVCANLAASLSQLFIDVILVDADLRKPTLTRVFRAESRPGLSDCLERGIPVSEAIIETGVERLRFMPAGATLQNPADLLGRERLRTVVQDLQAQCQCLIFDTSPLTACGDALLIGAHVDRALMVINPKNWQGDAESRLRDLLQEHKIDVLGVVLNGTDEPEAGSGYGYGYGSAYGYGHAPDSSNPSGATRRTRHGGGRSGAHSGGGPLKRLWERLSGGRERE